jgi:predicted ATP-dependent protease
VVDIEKEVALGGPIHSKGVLILAGFLGQRFASERPLSLAASLVFEQSYSGVEGDSASCGELVALLSALGEVPVRQGRAITGSVNQHGQVQPIGGVNEKIEGFFAVCKNRGLAGDQGVIIPEFNVKNLMLKKEVVDAVKEGKFRIYAIKTVNEALEILTGLPAGERQVDRTWPQGSINFLVDKRLKEMSKKLKADDKVEEKKEKKEENNEPAPKKGPPPGA